MVTHYFTPEELERKGKELAELELKKTKLENERKEIASSYKVQIDDIEEIVFTLSNHISTGFEMRPEPGLFDAGQNDGARAEAMPENIEQPEIPVRADE